MIFAEWRNNITMATLPSVSKEKQRKNLFQLESSVLEEEEFSDVIGSSDSNVTCGLEPNFNLNLNLTSPSNPRSAMDTSKLHAGSKKLGVGKSWVRGGTTTEAKTTLMSPSERQKSKIPALSRSPTAELMVNSKDEQHLKSPNLKHPLTLSPKIHAHSNTAASPKPHWLQQAAICSPRTSERVQMETPREESTKPRAEPTTKNPNKITLNIKMELSSKEDGKEKSLGTSSPQTLRLPMNPKVHDQKGDKNTISPKLANRTPAIQTKTKMTGHQEARQDSRTHGSEMSHINLSSQSQTAKSLSTKTLQVTSLSPKPDTQKKTTSTGNSNTSGFKENLDGKDSSTASRFKTSIKSSSYPEVTIVNKDSLDSKSSPNSQSQMGSSYTLDSKSSSAPKSSWDANDTLDLKTVHSPKASPSSMFRVAPRDSLGSKNASEIKVNKTQRDSDKVIGSKTEVGSKVIQDHRSLLDSKASFHLRTSPCVQSGFDLKKTSNSDVVSSSKSGLAQSTSRPALQGSDFKMDLSGSFSQTAITRGSLKTSGSRVKPSPDSKFESNASQSSSVVVDLSSSPIFSPEPVSASRSLGSSAGKSLGSSLPATNGEERRSPGSVPGVSSGLLAPLATSSPKIRTTITSKVTEGSNLTPAVSEHLETNPGSASHKTGLTRGLIFDPITKTQVKTCADVERKQLSLPESKVSTVGGRVLSQGTVNDNAGWSPGDNGGISGTLQSKVGHLGDINTITTGSNAPSSRLSGSHSDENGKQSPRSTRSPTSNRVNETATMTDLLGTLHSQRGEQKEVGTQVEVEVVERSTSTSPSLHLGAPISSLIGSPSYQSGNLTSPAIPSLCYIPAGQPPFKHVCKIDIELCSQTPLPSVASDKASSLPACLRTYSFRQNPTLMSELVQNHDGDVSTESIFEDEREDEEQKEHGGDEDGDIEEAEKPQEVAWDEQGMTWEVYGASVDLESLGTAIQSHLESKIREKEKHIWTLRKSICSDSSLRAYKKKKRKMRRGRILGCCGRSYTLAD